MARDSDLFLLVQHRAALFGIVLIACAWAAFDPSVRGPAVVATALSMLSVLVLWSLAGAPASLRTIALAAAVALPALACVAGRAFGA